MLWSPRLLRISQGFRQFSSATLLRQKVNQNSRAAVAVLDQKISSLMEQLEKEDAYMGPITSSQRTSDVQFGDATHIRPDLDRLRVVPSMMSFYMANPALEEALRSLRNLVLNYKDLPLIPETEYEVPVWINPSTLYGETKGGLSADSKRDFHDLLNRLNRIEPQLQPPNLQSLLYEMKDKNSQLNFAKIAGQPNYVTAILRKSLDDLGRSTTIGRRKEASARVIMARAHSGQTGKLFVNGRSIEQFFTSQLERQQVLYPLKVVDAFTKFNIFATVHGGGQTSKAAAVGLAVGKGLGVQNPLLVPRLQKADCLIRDNRIKERKKPGKAKARKSYGWVKR